MLWLQRPPWVKWSVTGLVVITAIWIEVAPDPSVMHPFATIDISPGDPIGALNTEEIRVPAGLLDPVIPGSHATGRIRAGEPVLASDTGEASSLVPSGWWVVAADLPPTARVGDPVQMILLDNGRAVAGIVASEPSDDPFGESKSGVAVEPEWAAEVAIAAASGRVAVLLGTG